VWVHDDGPGFVNDAENSYHVVTGSGTDDTAVLDGFTITAGNANGSDPYNSGGGMYNNAGSPTVSNCTFLSNKAGNGGGMANCSSSNPTLTNCRFSGNRAGFGGGIYNYFSFSNPTMVNCNFTGNFGNTGGGMYNYLSIPVLSNCTFADNSADSGGGMCNDSFSDTVLTNCILWGDAPEEVIALNSSTPVVTYSDVQGSWAGTGNIDTDPCFVQSGCWDDNGTAGDSNDDSWVAGDYRLRPDSPCIDVGDNNSVPADVNDFDGHPRIVDGDCNDSEIVDMGAYEFSWTYLGDFDGDCNVDLPDFSVFGLAWLSGQGDGHYNQICNIGEPVDLYIDWRDLGVFTNNWLAGP
jgi:parallel beta-helix repeat protein